MSGLGDKLRRLITAVGPISVADYMSLVLSDPEHGYYTTRTAIGLEGDFITAPEISQMFGELIGFFFVNLWQQMGSPKAFTLLELGPGRGTLMADLLRVACRAEGFRDSRFAGQFAARLTFAARRPPQARILSHAPGMRST